MISGKRNRKTSLLSLILTVAMLMTTLSVGFAMPVAAEDDEPLVTIDGVIDDNEGYYFLDAKERAYTNKTITYSPGFTFDENYIYFAVKTTTIKGDSTADADVPGFTFYICPNKDRNEFAFTGNNEDKAKNSLNTGFFNIETNKQVWNSSSPIQGATEMSAPSNDGYAYEIAIPISKLNFIPADGDMITFDLCIRNITCSNGTCYFSGGYTPSSYDKFAQFEYNLEALQNGADMSIVNYEFLYSNYVISDSLVLPEYVRPTIGADTIVDWKGIDGTIYKPGQTVTLDGDTTFTPVWKYNSEILIFDDAVSDNFKLDKEYYNNITSAEIDTTDSNKGAASYAVNFKPGVDNSIFEFDTKGNLLNVLKLDSKFIEDYSIEFDFKSDIDVDFDFNLNGKSETNQGARLHISLNDYYTNEDLGNWKTIKVPLSSGEYRIWDNGGFVTRELDFGKLIERITFEAHTRDNTEAIPAKFDNIRFVLNSQTVTINGAITKDPITVTKYDTYELPENIHSSTYNGEPITDDTTIIADFAITSAQPNLGESISMIYNAKIANSLLTSTPTMEFVMNGDTTTVDGVAGVVEGDYTNYSFEFKNITPKEIGDNISATLTVGNATATKSNYSIAEYCKNELVDPNNAGNTDLLTLLSDILAYGVAAQAYWGEGTAIDTSSITNYAPSTFTTVPVSDKLIGESSSEVKISALNLWFRDLNKIIYRVEVADANLENVKVEIYDSANQLVGTVNGNSFVKIADNQYKCYTPGISALNFGEVYTAILYENDLEVQAVEYSINSYVSSKHDDGNALAELVKALYNYGASTVAYNG